MISVDLPIRCKRILSLVRRPRSA